MKTALTLLSFACAAVVLAGCATYKRRGLEPAQAEHVTRGLGLARGGLPAGLQEQLLALDPEHVTECQIREVLSRASAPRIINIHGGIYPVHIRMISFSRFLVGMGYPEISITNPGDGTYTFSCYESSRKIAGMIAWHYEKEGLRPMIIGHSQGGMQAVKVLRHLAGCSSDKLAVWNPVTWKREPRHEICDPLSGQMRPVVGLRLPFACSLGGGGVTRVLPNQWDMIGRLRDIPNSVEEFTGYFKGWDLLGGDFLGWGPSNHFLTNGTTAVRNVRLPSWYKHGAVPDTEHLLYSQKMVDWINNYQPPAGAVSEPQLEVEFEGDSKHILWAADVWHSIKRHWVLELQRLVRAQRDRQYGH